MGVMEEMLATLEQIEKKLDGLPAAVKAGGTGLTDMGEGKITMTAKEVAELLGVNRNTVYEQAKQGRIPHIKAGSKFLFPRTALNDWLMEEAGDNYSRKKELDTDFFDLTG